MPRVAKRTSSASAAAPRRRPTTAVKRRVVHGRGGYWTDVKTRWSKGGNMVRPFRLLVEL